VFGSLGLRTPKRKSNFLVGGAITIYKWANDHLLMENPGVNYLVGGAITILKNDGVRQWEG
jgi:hypothetical protein